MFKKKYCCVLKIKVYNTTKINVPFLYNKKKTNEIHNLC